jgi:hypothetical protein
MSTVNTEKRLTLKLSPEVAKVMPWIVAAKASANPKQVAWAKREYETAQRRAVDRERREREAARRREEHERELCEHERAHLESVERLRARDEQLEKFGVHWAFEDGWEEIQPTQSSQKGWRRLLSEHSNLVIRRRYSKWGGNRELFGSGHHSVKHNCGRKPRKPWFKKARR